MFDARAFLAEQLPCRPDELTPIDGRTQPVARLESHAYTRRGATAGKVIATKPRRSLTGDLRRLIVAQGPDDRRLAQVEIDPDVEVRW